MRDYLLTAIVAVLLPIILWRPAVGAYAWAWLSIMNPHRLAYGFAYDFPWALLIAVVTLLAFVLTSKRNAFPVSTLTVTYILLMLWMTVTSIFTINDATQVWDRWFFVFKIHLMMWVTLMLLRGRVHIETLLWVVVLSVAFFGVKGGIYTLVMGGGGRVWGPPGGMIEDNNSLAVALVVILPLMYYLLQTVKLRAVRFATVGAMAMVGLAALGTQSRGAFLAVVAMAMMLGLKGKHPIRSSAVILSLVVLAVAFMPDSWVSRMETIQDYKADTSALSRVYTWHTLWNVAVDRPLVGAGFRADNLSLFLKYAPTDAQYNAVRGAVLVAHSIYFQALGEHGFPGLALYLFLWISLWYTATSVARKANEIPELAHWAPLLMRMCQVSLVGFLVGGAFLSLMHLDLTFYILAVVVLTHCAVKDKLREQPEGQRAAANAGLQPIADDALVSRPGAGAIGVTRQAR